MSPFYAMMFSTGRDARGIIKYYKFEGTWHTEFDHQGSAFTGVVSQLADR